MPETSKTIVWLPKVEVRPSRRLPGPESFTLMTWYTSPPRPPTAKPPAPSAPENAAWPLDDVTVLKDGRVVGAQPISEVTRAQLI